MAIIVTIEQLCRGETQKYGTKSEWMIAGRVISIRDGQVVIDDKGYKCAITNAADFEATVEKLRKGDDVIGLIEVEKCFAKMVRARASKLMPCADIEVFRHHLKGLGRNDSS